MLLYCFICIFVLGGVFSEGFNQHDLDRSIFGKSLDPVKLIKFIPEHSFNTDNFTSGSVPLEMHMKGSAEILDNRIVLNALKKDDSGSIWFKSPNHNDVWAVTIAFKIDMTSKDVGDDGMAFWYTDEIGDIGNVYGSSKLWMGIGIFLDSYDNNGDGKNPVVLAVYNNKKHEYDVKSDGVYSNFSHEFINYRLNRGISVLRIIYMARNLIVEIIDHETKGYQFKKCIEYSPIFLGKEYYFGVSAQSNIIPDSHSIIGYSTYGIDAGVELGKAMEKDKGLYNRTLSYIHDITKSKVIEDIGKYKHALSDSKVKDTFEEYGKSQLVEDVYYLEYIMNEIKESQMDINEKLSHLTEYVIDLKNEVYDKIDVCTNGTINHYNQLKKQNEYVLLKMNEMLGSIRNKDNGNVGKDHGFSELKKINMNMNERLNMVKDDIKSQMQQRDSDLKNWLFCMSCLLVLSLSTTVVMVYFYYKNMKNNFDPRYDAQAVPPYMEMNSGGYNEVVYRGDKKYI